MMDRELNYCNVEAELHGGNAVARASGASELHELLADDSPKVFIGPELVEMVWQIESVVSWHARAYFTGSRANLRSDTSLLATRYLYDSETIGLKEFEIQPIALNSTGRWRVAKANAASASLAASAAAPIVSGGAPSSDFRGIKPPLAPLRSVYSTIA